MSARARRDNPAFMEDPNNDERKATSRWLSHFRMRGDREQSWGPSKVRRIGVPGADVHLNTRRACVDIFRWRGSAWKAALTSPAAAMHVLVYAALWYALAVANHVYATTQADYARRIIAYSVPTDVVNAVTFVFSFIIAQYIAFVVGRYAQRVDVCIATVEAASQVALQSSVLLRAKKRQALRLIRLTHLVLHLHYLTIDGPMIGDKWRLCERRGLITAAERLEIQRLASPEAAAFVWALEVVHAAWRAKTLSDDHAVRLETELSAVKRHASSQKDYHESPIPMPCERTPPFLPTTRAPSRCHVRDPPPFPP